MWDNWKKLFSQCIDKHAPLRTKRLRTPKSPWITPQLKKRMHYKNVLKVKAIRSGNALQSCYVIPTIDKPTHVRNNSATLIDNIFVNNPEQVQLSGNLITDLSDHFAQICIMKSVREKPTKLKKHKVHDYSQRVYHFKN